MPFDLTILTRKVEGLKEAFQSGRFGEALVTALHTGQDDMRNRIFDTNKDIEGQGFGQYIGSKKKLSDRSQVALLFGTTSKTDKKRIKESAGLELTSYQRKRVHKGRQVVKKDLYFTGTLSSSIRTQVDGENGAVLEFSNDLSAKIAHGQEQQITNIRDEYPGTTKGHGAEVFKIFRLNQTEKEKVIEQGKELIIQILKSK